MTCSFCKAGWSSTYWVRYDGYGRQRLHPYFNPETMEMDSHFCQSQSWFSRHPFYTVYWAITGLTALGVLIACLSR